MNILLITTDEQTWDALGAAGNGLVKTPNLDRLAAQGVRFTCHTAHAPVCTPARATILTGLYTRTHGARLVGFELDKSRPTIAHRLADAGFATGVFGKCHFEAELTGIAAGWPLDEPYYGFTEHAISEDDQRGRYFDWLVAHHPEYEAELRRTTHEDSPLRDAAWHEPRPDGTPPGYCPAEMPEHTTQTHWIAEHARQFLDRRADDGKPFLAWCSFVQPHHPWNPPRSYLDQYDPADMPIPTRDDGAHGGPGGWYNDGRGFTDRQLQELQAAYYAMCTQIDHEVGKILDRLEHHGLADDTLVLFTSDHGDYNCRRGMVRKIAGWYESILRVPMIARLPGGARGVTHDHPTQHVDLMPTMLEAAGLPPVAGVAGRSLLPVLRGGHQPLRELAYYELGGYHTQTLTMTTGVSDGRWKLIRYADERGWVLTDLKSDPEEDHNLIDTPAAASHAARLKEALAIWLSETPHYCPPKPAAW
jgi:arylsulfatase A-like enzyme